MKLFKLYGNTRYKDIFLKIKKNKHRYSYFSYFHENSYKLHLPANIHDFAAQIK